MKFNYKELYTLEHRTQEASRILSKYPGRIPVIAEAAPRSQIQIMDKQKFLIPSEISVAELILIIRKRIRLTETQAIYLFVGKLLPQSSASMADIYEQHKDEDGFLYIGYSGENTFGTCL